MRVDSGVAAAALMLATPARLSSFGVIAPRNAPSPMNTVCMAEPRPC